MKIDKKFKNVLSIIAFETALNMCLVSEACAEEISAETLSEAASIMLVPTVAGICTVCAFGISHYKKEKKDKLMRKRLKRELKYVHEENEDIKLIF